MSRDVLEAIHELLGSAGLEFEEAEHGAVRTAEEAAAARGCTVRMGAKSLVVKTDDVFRLFVLSGAQPFRSRKARKHLGVRRTRFASAEELLDLTGVIPGAVPPFGRPILPLDLYVDPSLLENERIAFTPGVPTISIIMRAQDYLDLAQPEIFDFSGD